VLGDIGVAVFNAGEQKLEEKIILGFDVVVERTLEHADVAGDVFDGSGVESLGEKNVGGAVQDFLEAGAGLGFGGFGVRPPNMARTKRLGRGLSIGFF
jgi:hypothetical protein